MKGKIAKGIVSLVIVFSLITPIKAHAATLAQTLAYAALATTMVSNYYNNLNEHGQEQSLRENQRKTGVLNDNDNQQYVHRIVEQLKSSGLIKGKYAIYANPDNHINAFCTIGRVVSVNKGSLDALDEDELAAMIGHELGHGEEKDPVHGITKALGVGIAVDLYLSNNANRTSYVLSSAAGNMIYNEVFTMDQEWRADNHGFEYAVAAGYNPGGPAAQMVKVRSIYGDLWSEGFARIKNPNNHPKTRDRIDNFSKKVTEFSDGHVTVKNDTTVQINGLDIVTPVKAYNHLASERAYLIAGKFARLYHDNEIDTAYVGDDGGVYIGNHLITIPADGDSSAEDFVNKVNVAISK